MCFNRSFCVLTACYHRTFTDCRLSVRSYCTVRSTLPACAGSGPPHLNTSNATAFCLRFSAVRHSLTNTVRGHRLVPAVPATCRAWTFCATPPFCSYTSCWAGSALVPLPAIVCLSAHLPFCAAVRLFCSLWINHRVPSALRLFYAVYRRRFSGRYHALIPAYDARGSFRVLGSCLAPLLLLAVGYSFMVLLFSPYWQNSIYRATGTARRHAHLHGCCCLPLRSHGLVYAPPPATYTYACRRRSFHGYMPVHLHSYAAISLRILPLLVRSCASSAAGLYTTC